MEPQPQDGNSNDEKVVINPKQQRTKKARKANSRNSSLVDEPSMAATTMPPLYLASEGQQQQGGKRHGLVWTDQLHDVFVEAYNSLGEDAVPKKILEKMNIPGVSRENVASHLQKYRLTLKQVGRRIPTSRGAHQRAPCAQVPTQTASPALHPQEPASGPLHHPLPRQACFEGHEVSQPRRGHDYDQLLQTPPDPFWCSSIPIEEYHTPPLESTIGMPGCVEGGGAQTMTGFPAVPHVQEASASQAMNVREVSMGRQMCTKADDEQGRGVGSKSLSPANNLFELYWQSGGEPFPWDVYTQNKSD